MTVNQERHFAFRWAVPGVLVVLVLAGSVALSARARAQAQNPTSATDPFWGSATAQPAAGEALKLSLDDAVERGFKNNLGLKEAENEVKSLHGEKNVVLQEFLPTIALTGDTGYHMYDLAALGFRPNLLSGFSSFPGGKTPAGFSNITRVDQTDGQIQYNEILFSGPVIAGWKAAGAAERSANLARIRARGEVVQRVATTYLRAIADESEVKNAQALVAQAQVLEDHTRAEHQAGTAANLDELRARVQLQTQQQALIAAENQQAKGPDPAQARDRARSRPGDRADRSGALQRAGRRDSGRGAGDRIQVAKGLPDPAEPGGGAQGGARSLSQPAAADIELQQLLRHHHRRRHGHARQLRGCGHAEHSALPRGAAARR